MSAGVHGEPLRGTTEAREGRDRPLAPPRASEPPGGPPVRHVFGLTTGADTAGINVAIKGAFDRHGSGAWRADSMVASSNYLEYPVDVPYDPQQLRELYDAADVVHLHNTTHGHRWYDDGQGKPTVLHHHGRKDLHRTVKEAARLGAAQLGSTYDLSLLEPGVEWLPTPVHLERLRELRARWYRSGDRVRIMHAPTNRAIKGTEEFLAAFDDPRLAAIAEPVLVTGVTWDECLRVKATCDVVYDQLLLGYGSNAVEAFAMGIPVIAGVADPEIRAGMLQRWGRLPFLESRPGELAAALALVATQADVLLQYAAWGAHHVQRFHDERRTVAQLEDIYGRAKRTVPGPRRKPLAPTAKLLASRERRASIREARLARL